MHTSLANGHCSDYYRVKREQEKRTFCKSGRFSSCIVYISIICIMSIIIHHVLYGGYQVTTTGKRWQIYATYLKNHFFRQEQIALDRI